MFWRFRNATALWGVVVTKILLTVDTELSALLHQQGAPADVNFARSIDCSVGERAVGIGWQMDRLEAQGLKGVFFVDPMPALVYGPDVIARIVAPIVARGHEAQLHIHTEWLQWAGAAPVATRGQNIGDFRFADQVTLIDHARRLLVEAGVPTPIAFRAGNYGANDDTLRALATLGVRWDSSFNAAYIGKPCGIGLDIDQVDPIERQGVGEIPVSAIFDRPRHIRHAQICALSEREVRAALDHAAATQRPTFTIVTHSFEMLSRDRMRANHAVMRRFEALCRHIAAHDGLDSVGFADLTPDILASDSKGKRLPPNRLRTALRVVEQGVATLIYERQLRPA